MVLEGCAEGLRGDGGGMGTFEDLQGHWFCRGGGLKRGDESARRKKKKKKIAHLNKKRSVERGGFCEIDKREMAETDDVCGG